jgi:hypothetical protein
MEIIGVQQLRDLKIDPITFTASQAFNIYFDEYTEYLDMAALIPGAVDPTTSLRVPEKEGEVLGSAFGDIVVKGISIGPFDGQNLWWTAEIDYGEVDTVDYDKADMNINKWPWDLPKTYRWSHYFEKTIMIEDEDGVPILNSANDPFENELLVDRTIQTCNVEFNIPMSAFDPTIAAGYVNKVNKNQMTIEGFPFDATLVKTTGYDAETQTANVTIGNVTKVVNYKAVSVTFAIDPLTWDGFILDIGNKELGAKDQIADGAGNFFTMAQRLNGNGKRLVKDDGENFNPIFDGGRLDNNRKFEGVAAFIKYKKYKEIDLNQIGV